jgi:hypothetical protein
MNKILEIAEVDLKKALEIILDLNEVEQKEIMSNNRMLEILTKDISKFGISSNFLYGSQANSLLFNNPQFLRATEVRYTYKRLLFDEPYNINVDKNIIIDREVYITYSSENGFLSQQILGSNIYKQELEFWNDENFIIEILTRNISQIVNIPYRFLLRPGLLLKLRVENPSIFKHLQEFFKYKYKNIQLIAAGLFRTEEIEPEKFDLRDLIGVDDYFEKDAVLKIIGIKFLKYFKDTHTASKNMVLVIENISQEKNFTIHKSMSLIDKLINEKLDNLSKPKFLQVEAYNDLISKFEELKRSYHELKKLNSDKLSKKLDLEFLSFYFKISVFDIEQNYFYWGKPLLMKLIERSVLNRSFILKNPDHNLIFANKYILNHHTEVNLSDERIRQLNISLPDEFNEIASFIFSNLSFETIYYYHNLLKEQYSNSFLNNKEDVQFNNEFYEVIKNELLCHIKK